jgi:hypothetical protein
MQMCLRDLIKYDAAMNDVFHGWRRKVGAVTMVMACLVMGMWFRSWHTFDVITLHGRRGFCTVINSECGKIWLVRRTDTPGQHFYISDRAVVDRLEVLTFQYRWTMAGISYAHADPRVELQHLVFVSFPHTWIAIPLTLLSAYLILWKPRKWGAQ